VRDLQDRPVDKDLLEEVITRAVEQEAGAIDHFSLVILDNEGITDLNRRLLSRERPTDVIAFEAETDPDGVCRAEAYISVEQAQMQAQQQGHTLDYELAFLAAHAALHALGYDDGTEQQRARMLDRQRQIVSRTEEQRTRG
jgi:probable rRNA maturation factor